jgi:D-xylose 1-dehydrogenase (NADP+, D-xylono-1,5-lactone-forming)
VSVCWGILSTARINEKVLAGAKASEAVAMIAVASRDATRAESYAREHRFERAYGSYAALLEDPDVDAVYISLPNGFHVDWTLRALEAGKHVLCEKPFSRRLDEVERVYDLAEAAGLVVSEGFMWRHHPQTARLLELVACGTIGPVRVVRAAFSFQLAAAHGADDTRFDPDLEGGALMDVGCYCVNAIRLLAGEPARVHAEQVVGQSGVDVVFAATLRLPGDVLGQFHCGFVLPVRYVLEVVGEEGSLVVPDPFHVYSPGIELRLGADVDQLHVEQADSYRLELENVSAAIRGVAPLLLGRDDAVGQARTIEALYRSADASTPVMLAERSSA